jgi:hypothetical protein
MEYHLKKNKRFMLRNSNNRSFIMAAAASLSFTASIAQHEEHTDFGQALTGRWDLTVTAQGKASPAWIEIHKSGSNRLVGYYVGSGGSARPVSKVNYLGEGKFAFTIPPQWEKENHDITITGQLSGEMLSGTVQEANDSIYNWSAQRAPELRPAKDPVWGKPIQLLNGKTLEGWTAFGDSKEDQWKLIDGILTSDRKGKNLATNQKFNDFKLHIEFKVPDTSNSGIYLRGRYEVQVIGKSWNEPPKNGFSSVYGFIEPTENASKSAGEWQTYDITLVGRFLTLVANGKTVICNQIIPGITGGALDSHEGEPGPIYIQGDHGPVEYRNITITPAK